MFRVSDLVVSKLSRDFLARTPPNEELGRRLQFLICNNLQTPTNTVFY